MENEYVLILNKSQQNISLIINIIEKRRKEDSKYYILYILLVSIYKSWIDRTYHKLSTHRFFYSGVGDITWHSGIVDNICFDSSCCTWNYVRLVYYLFVFSFFF